MTCDFCNKDHGGIDGYAVINSYNQQKNYCSRICLIEGIAPELRQAIVPVQWLCSYDPSPEEIERMSQ